MPLDPLSALGLASNVLQFIDFTSKLFSLTSEVYHSANGASKETEELEVITKHLQSLCEGVWQPLKDPTERYPQDNALRELSRKCFEAGDELLQALGSLQMSGTNKRWNSFRSALATIWRRKDISKMYERLESLKSELALHFIMEKSSLERLASPYFST
jgi:hypothetical protein